MNDPREAPNLLQVLTALSTEHFTLAGRPIQTMGEGSARALTSFRVPDAVDALRGLSYEHHGEGDVTGREYLTRRPADGPTSNVHVFAVGDSLLNDNRMIRDYLPSTSNGRRRLRRMKQGAVEQGHVDLLSYSHAKVALA